MQTLRPSILLLAAAGLAAGTGLLAGSARSQNFVPTAQSFVPLGSSADEKVSTAWFIDVPRQQVVFCKAAVNGDKGSCLTVKLP